MPKKISENEKQQIIDYVAQHNQKKGKGGITAAAEKFEIHPITIGRWLKEEGIPLKSLSQKKAPVQSSTKKSVKSSSNNKTEIMKKLEQIQSYQTQIEALNQSIEKAKSEIIGLIE